MARRTNEFVQFAGHFQSLVTELSRRMDEREMNIVEVIADVVQPENAATLDKIADILAGVAMFSLTNELTLQVPALPRPTLTELRKKFSRIREKNGIERDTSPTGAVTLKLGTVLHPKEEHVDGHEYERRIAPKLNVILGYQQAAWLVDHQDEFPELMALLGKVYIEFLGLVVVHADGRRSFPCLSGGGRRWDLHWYWVGDGLDRRGRLAVSGK